MQRNRVLFALVLASTVISGIGTGMSLIGIPWALTAGGGSTSLVSAYMMASYLALALSLPRFAAAVDRVSRKRLALCLAATGFIVQLTMAAVEARQVLSALLVASGFISMVLRSFDRVNSIALTRDLFDSEDYPVLNRRMEVARQAITLIAGGVAAYMLSRWAISSILAIDAASYLSAFVLMSFLPDAEPACASPRPPADSAGPGPRPSLRDTWAILSRDRQLLSYALATLAPFIGVLMLNVLYPAHFRRYLGASAGLYAVVSLIYGGGAMSAAVVVRIRERGVPRGALIRAAFVGYLGAALVTALIPHVAATYVGAFLFALCHAVIRIERTTLLMRVFDRGEIGRVTGFFEALTTAANVVLIGLLGLVMDHVSVRAAWLLFAALLLPAADVVRRAGPEVSERDALVRG